VVKREEHTIVDFMIGKEIGIGVLEESTFSAGVRYADLGSTTSAHIFGMTHWNFPFESNKYPGNGSSTHDRYEAILSADRQFTGAGPIIDWEASKSLLGTRDVGLLGLDWMLSGGVLFGDRKTAISGTGTSEHVAKSSIVGKDFPTSSAELPPVNMNRSESVSAPVFGAALGLSYRVDRFRIGAGYRWERYQDAIDGGFTESKAEDRTIDGPYFKLSVGFGG
jgi:hypothetical protein